MRITAVLVALVGCTGPEEVVGPTVRIVVPEDGATVCGTPLHVELETTDFEWAPMGGEAVEGEGHVDFTANGQAAGMTIEPAFDTQLDEDGTYVLAAGLVYADHTPYDPPAVDEITVQVDASVCGAAE
jgi:hypothetical protein